MTNISPSTTTPSTPVTWEVSCAHRPAKLKGALLLLLGLFYLCACKKTGDGKTHPDPRLLQAFSFKPGTYWIYYDSVTGKEDSMYVYMNQTVATEVAESLGVIFIYGQDNRTYYGYFVLDGSRLQVSFLYTDGVLLNYPLSIGSVPGSSSAEIIKTYFSSEINGQHFGSLSLIRYTSSDGRYKSTLYVKEKVGIIEISVYSYDSTTHITNRSLLRHKIII